jgi:tetratricopeptide (TPR) repeat protein
MLENQMEGLVRFKEGLDLARISGSPAILAEGLSWWAIGYSNDADETKRCLEEAHQIAEKLGNTRVRIYNLWDYGWVETVQDNQASAAVLLKEALRLAQLLKDRHQGAHCELLLGRLATQRGDYIEGRVYEEKSSQIFRDLSDPFCAVRAIFYIGWNAFLNGEIAKAQECFDECLAISRENPSLHTVLIPLGQGWIRLAQGDFPKARVWFSEGLDSLKNKPGSTYLLVYFLEAVCALPDITPETAAGLLGHAQLIREREAFAIPSSERRLVAPLFEALRARLDPLVYETALAAGKALPWEQVILEALTAIQPGSHQSIP